MEHRYFLNVETMLYEMEMVGIWHFELYRSVQHEECVLVNDNALMLVCAL